MVGNHITLSLLVVQEMPVIHKEFHDQSIGAFFNRRYIPEKGICVLGVFFERFSKHVI